MQKRNKLIQKLLVGTCASALSLSMLVSPLAKAEDVAAEKGQESESAAVVRKAPSTLEEAKANLDKATKELQEAKAVREAKEEAVAEIGNAIAETEKTKETADGTIMEVSEAAPKTIAAIVEKATEEVKQANEALVAAEEKKAALEKEVQDLESKVNDLATQKAENEKKGEAFINAHPEYNDYLEKKQQADALEGEIAGLKAEIEEKESMVKTFEEEKANKTAQLESLKNQESEISNAIAGKQAEIAAQEQKVAEAQGAIDAAKAQETADQAEVDRLEGEKANLLSQKANLENDLAGLNGELANLNEQMNQLAGGDGALDALKQDVETAKTALAEKTAALETAKSDLEKAEGQKQAAEKALDDLNAEKARLESEIEKTNADLERVRAEYAKAVEDARLAMEAAKEATTNARGFIDKNTTEGVRISDHLNAFLAKNADRTITNFRTGKTMTIKEVMNDPNFTIALNWSTSKEGLEKAMDWIDKSNELRQKEGAQTLKVDMDLMSLAIMSNVISMYEAEHTVMNGHDYADPTGRMTASENLAWGYKDPFKGWYDEEKAIYESGEPGVTGHYENLVGKPYDVTGFAVTPWLTNGKTPTNNSLKVHAHAQHFSNGAYGKTYTTAEFREALNQYLADKVAEYEREKNGYELLVNTVPEEITNLEKAKADAQKNLTDTLAAIPQAETDVQTADTSVKNLTNQVAEKTAEKAAAEEALKEKAEALKKLEESLAEKDEAIAKLQKDIEAKEAEIAGKQAEVAAKADEIKKQEDLIEKAKAVLADAKEKVSEKETAKADEEALLAKIRSLLGEKEAELVANKESQKEVEGDIQKLADEKAALENAITGLQDTIIEKTNEIRALGLDQLDPEDVKTFMELTNEKETIANNIKDLETAISEKKAAKAVAEKDLAAATTTLSEKEQALAKAKAINFDDPDTFTDFDDVQALYNRLQAAKQTKAESETTLKTLQASESTAEKELELAKRAHTAAEIEYILALADYESFAKKDRETSSKPKVVKAKKEDAAPKTGDAGNIAGLGLSALASATVLAGRKKRR